MRKFRGKKRYYRELERHSDFSKLTAMTFNKDSWFDLWHTHYDWKGFGNKSWKKRKPHLDTLFRNFDLYPERLKSIEKHYQLFIQINDIDSSQDSVNIHTANPNRDNFPLKANLSRECKLTNQQLINYLDKKKGFEKLYGMNELEAYCILYRPGTGEKIE